MSGDNFSAAGADKRAALGLIAVSRETEGRLDCLVALLKQWQATINLVAPSTLPHLWMRHIADSLQLLSHWEHGGIWVDLGSGAGFPGLAIACALEKDAGTVHLVESDTRKAAFLREAVRLTKVQAEVHAERIENFSETWPGRPDVVTARALAPMGRLLELADPMLQRGAQGLFLKGQDVEAELTEAAKSWHIDADLLPSVTDPRGRIVRVRRAVRRPKRR